MTHARRRALQYLTICLLGALASGSLHGQGSSLNGHAVRLDASNKLLAWPAVQGDAYDQILGLATNYLLNGVPNAPNGLKLYYTESYATPTNPVTPSGWPHNPAGLYSMLTDSGLYYYAYSGNVAMGNLVRDVLTYDLDHGLTPSNWDWPGVAFASADAESLTYQGASYGNSTGVGDGTGVIQPDKVGEIGVAYLKYYQYSGATRFRDAAIQAANVLASHVRTGSSTQSPWPFRVYAQTNVIREQYTAHVISPIQLFDELIRLNLGNVSAYQTARQTAWTWLMTYPMQNNVWSNYFEDVNIYSDLSNVNQLNAAETARYLMNHPQFDPNWQTHARGIITWIESQFAVPQYGANSIAEQFAFEHPLGSHTSRYASLNAQLYELTGDTAALEKAYRSFNWATYMCGSNGVVIDGPDVNNVWWTDGYGDYIKHFLEGMGSAPQFAPQGQTHLLRSSSVVHGVEYAAGDVRYITFDQASREVLRLNFVPQSVTADGSLLPYVNDPALEGWTFDSATGVLRVRHSAGTQIRVSDAVLSNNIRPTVTIDSPSTGQYQTPTSLNLAASASDADGSINRVEFYQNGVFVSAKATAPYEYTWLAVPLGYYQLTAVAVDDRGARTTSAPVTVLVFPPMPPPGPANLIATTAGTAINLVWSPPSGGPTAVGYGVYRSTTSGFTPGPANLIAQPSATSFSDGGLSGGVYYYRVVAFDAAGTASAFSNEAGAGILQVDKVVFSDGSGTRTSPAFTTATSGELLLAFAASDGPSSGEQTLTVSGAGLTWTLVARVTTQHGSSEIWKAIAPGVLTNATVTCTQSSGNFDQSLTVVTFSGGGTGASAVASSIGVPSVSLTTTRPASFVYGVGNDWDHATSHTAGATQAMVHQWVDTTGGDTLWVQSRTTVVPSAGTIVQLNDTAPTGDRWNFAAVEITTATLPPTVTGMTPINGTTGAGLGTAVTATFAADMNPATITTATFELLDSAGNPVPASVSYVGATHTATLQPASPLFYFSGYTAKVVGGATGAKDTAGNALAADVTSWFATVAPPDTTPPIVATLTPANGATDVATSSGITVKFNEDVSLASLTTSTLELRNPADAVVAATISYNSATHTARLQPIAPLPGAATYTARVRGGVAGVKDLAGNALVQDVVWSFTAAGAPSVGASTRGRYSDESNDIATTTAITTQPTTNLVLYVHGEGQTSVYPAITDTYHNVWVPAGVQQTSTWPGFLWVFTSVNAQGGPGHAFTATKPNNSFLTLLAVEVIGTNIGIESSTLGIDDVSPFATGPMTPTRDALLLAAFAPGYPGELVTITPGNGFSTVVENDAGDGAWVASVAARTVPAGSYQASWTMTGGGNDFDYGLSGLVITGTPFIDLTKPLVTGLTPAAGSLASTLTAVTATFSERLNPATVNGATLELRDANGALVPGTVTYNGTTNTARLQPAGPLNPTTVYTARVVGGAAGVKDLADNPLASDVTAAFTAAIIPMIGVSAQGRYGDDSADMASTVRPVVTQPHTNFIVYVHGEGGTSAYPTLTDTYGNTWTPVGVQQTSSWPGFLWTFVSLNAHGGPGHRFTATKPNAFQTILAIEVLGANGAAVAVRESALGIDNSSPFTTPDVHPSTDVLLLGVFAPGFPQEVVTITPGNGFATVVEENRGDGAWVESVASRGVPAGTYNASWTMTGGANDFDFAAGVLVLSTGVIVPNLVGLTDAGASSTLTSAGLATGAISTQSSTTAPVGTVMGQTPTAGTHVTDGTVVSLVVSSGVAVPDVVGLSQANAQALLAGASLALGTVTTQTSTSVSLGLVISQSPAASTQASGGTPVSLTLSSGVTVPDVVGQPQATAASLVTGASLAIGAVTTANSMTVPSGTVISQSPAANTQATAGAAVNLVVSVGPPMVTAPTVVGLTQAAAQTQITGASLTVGTVTTQASTTVPIGSVISQSPLGGTQAVLGSAVNLIVSSGVTVPNVVGQPQATAQSLLTGVGLTVGTLTTQSSTTVPSGAVISQSPAASTQVSGGTAVNLVVSTGPPMVTVPTVVGLSQAAAQTQITGASLAVGTVTTQASTTVPIGSVISQSPLGGTQAVLGSAVNLIVSSGVTVPNVVGQPQATAQSQLTGAGLTVGTVTTQSSTTVPSGAVISQSPAASTQVSGGTAVSLVVSTGPANITVDATVSSDGLGTLTTAAFSTTAPGEIVLAFGSSDGPSGGGQTLTISGAGLTWTLVRRANSRPGTSEIWKATAATQLTNVTVSATQSSTTYRQSLTVVAFKGASGTGASAGGGAATGAPSVSLVTTVPGSIVYGVGNDWTQAVTHTLGPTQTMIHQWLDTTGGDTYWVQARTGAVTNANTSVQINDTAPTNDSWNLAVVEIVR